MDRNDFNIGRNIRRYRLESKLTQEETIERLMSLGIRMSRGTYSHIECGLDNIRVEELLALAEIFRVEAGDFFKGMSLRCPETVCREEESY